MSIKNLSDYPDYYLELLKSYASEIQSIKIELEKIKGIPSPVIDKLNYFHKKINNDIKNHRDKGQPESRRLYEDDN
ncbi:hypothetical protein H6G81_18380 [Scytonema hofmannii FACHB-248]|uniref:Uncharacterized protein n=1 Tax=Scytonema hofmannii FACHB-248 TaxID=1842502 RepID=A0ABR8GTP9_9CYAN|nr:MULTISPECIES: hypothetical protein [Nostocales]MBD2606444.1 hypothetical protein [Scytonema hofmannii FACHB-248]